MKNAKWLRAKSIRGFAQRERQSLAIAFRCLHPNACRLCLNPHHFAFFILHFSFYIFRAAARRAGVSICGEQRGRQTLLRPSACAPVTDLLLTLPSWSEYGQYSERSPRCRFGMAKPEDLLGCKGWPGQDSSKMRNGRRPVLPLRMKIR